ncbi:hypothetical protein ACWGH8_23890 [Nonomuraea muscovyensis]
MRKYAEAGRTDLALVQIGHDRQEPFFDWAAKELLPTRSASCSRRPRDARPACRHLRGRC